MGRLPAVHPQQLQPLPGQPVGPSCSISFEGPKIEPLLFEWLWILQIFIDYL